MYICATAVVAAQVNGDQQTEKRYRQFDVIYFQYKLFFLLLLFIVAMSITAPLSYIN